MPFTSAAHCSSLSSVLQLPHIMPHSLCYRTHTGEICLDCHFAVGCGWCRVMVVGVYFHRTNEWDPFVSIILGCLNYLWIHGFSAVLSQKQLDSKRFSFSCKQRAHKKIQSLILQCIHYTIVPLISLQFYFILNPR